VLAIGKLQRRDKEEASKMSEERLWKFRKPEWMNSAVARSAGVYAAGALVGYTLFCVILRPILEYFGFEVGSLASRLMLHQLTSGTPAISTSPNYLVV